MLNETIEYKGYWWLPSTPDKKVAGTLKYIPNDSIRLEVIGSLGTDDEILNELHGDESISVIHGFTSDAKHISLFNCFSSGSLNFSCNFPIMRYSCSHLFVGIHMNAFDDECFFKATIQMPELSLWCFPGALQTTLTKKEESSDYTAVSISWATDRPYINSLTFEDFKLSLESCVKYHGEHLSPEIKQYTSLVLESNKDRSFSQFRRLMYLFKQFLSLATLRTVTFSSIKLYCKNKYQELSSGRHYHAIDYMFVQHDKTVRPTLNHFDCLFDYKTIQSSFDSVINKWLSESDDIAPIREHMIDCIKSKRIFSSADFLIVVQALEGFWWRFRDSSYREKNNISRRDRATNLNTIITQLIGEFDSVWSRLKLNEINIPAVVDSRHYYSHFMPKSKKPNALDGLELYHLTSQLRKLLVCCMLDFMGFSHDEMRNIIKYCNNSILR